MGHDARFLNAGRRYIAVQRERCTRELAEFVAIPSVGSERGRRADMQRCAEWVARQLRQIGCEVAEIVHAGGQPAVIAHSRANAGRPRLVVYGHYDVQPAQPLGAWRTPPFRPSVRGGYLYARGASDDKGQLFAHLKALELLRHVTGRMPPGITFLIEGEEEVGSPSLPALLRRFGTELAGNVALISDTPALDRRRPSITYGLRGDLYLDVEVARAADDLHSGNFGGAVANPLRAMVAALGRLHAADGRIAVPGFHAGLRPVPRAERRFIRGTGPRDGDIRSQAGGAPLDGEQGYSAYERLAIRPSLEIAGVSGGYTGSGVKGVIPARASAKLDVRLVADQDPAAVGAAITTFLRRCLPTGVSLRVTERMRALPVLLAREHPYVRLMASTCRAVFGADPAFVRSGGSIPVVALLARCFDMPALLVGFGLPGDGAHAPNERFSLSMLEDAALASGLFMRELCAA